MYRPKQKHCCLQAGYSVVFLSRKGSFQPFIHSSFPELVEAADLVNLCSLGARTSGSAPTCSDSASEVNASELTFSEEHKARITAGVVAAQAATLQHRLLTIHFSTVFEYLKYLEVIARALQVCYSASFFKSKLNIFWIL